MAGAEMALPQPLANLVGVSRPAAANERAVVSGSVARYQVLRRLARGGMADVYLATQRTAQGTEQTVVIKRLRAELRRDPEFGKMFQDEVQIAVRLDHPNVVKVIEPLVTGSETLLVMEWVQGRSLSAILNRARKRERPLDPALVAAIGAHVAAGLQHAHDLRDADGNRMGVIHRDVSPQNIMIATDGVAKVLDFGVAWVLGRMSRTRVGVAKGKLGYMAPEQLEHRAIDQRTDIFALGVVLWEALAGRRLFPLDKDGVAIRAPSASSPEPPSAFRSIPPELDRIVMRALAREPHRRPRNAAEIESELAAFAAAHNADATRVSATVAELFDGTNVGRHERHRTSATVAIRQPGPTTATETPSARAPAALTPAALTPGMLTSGAVTPPLTTPLPPPSLARAAASKSSGPHAPPGPSPSSSSPSSSSPSLLASQSMPTFGSHAGSVSDSVHGMTPAADYASEVSRFP
ncbi:MAG: serine/threonine-protein kinase, partial [Pseudomonadota bacterium]